MLVICHSCHRAVELETPEEDGFKCPYCQKVHLPENSGLRDTNWDDDEEGDLDDYSDLEEERTPTPQAATNPGIGTGVIGSAPPQGAAVSAGYQERMRSAVARGEFPAIESPVKPHPSPPQTSDQSAAPEERPPVAAEVPHDHPLEGEPRTHPLPPQASEPTDDAIEPEGTEPPQEDPMDEITSPSLLIPIDIATGFTEPTLPVHEEHPKSRAGKQAKDSVPKTRTHWLPTGDWGRLLIFCVGLALGASWAMDWTGRIQKQTDREAAALRAQIDRVTTDRQTELQQAEAHKKRMAATLHVGGSTRLVDLKTGQHKGQDGYSGISQSLVITPSGKMWRLWSGRLKNGTTERFEAVKVTMRWSRAGEERVANLPPFGEVSGLTMGRCADKAPCQVRRPVITPNDLVDRATLAEAEALLASRSVAPGVLLSIDPEVTQPFLFFEPADSLALVPDHWIRVTIKR